jgi:hypothetical protein
MAVLVLMCVAATTTARAADRDKDQAAINAEAKAHFKKGTQAYRLANFEQALGHFSEAMKLSPRPSVILNMAQCHRQLEHNKKALFFYKLYLTEWSRTNPTAKQSPPFNKEVTGYIEELDKKQAAAKLAPKPEPKAEPKPEPTAKPTPEPTPAPVAAVRTPPRDQGTSVKKIAGWTLIAAGAGLTVSGIVLGVLASEKSNELEQLGNAGGKNFSDHDDIEAEGQALNNGMIATLSIGAGAAVGGAVMILLHYTDLIEARNAWLAPSVTPGGAMVAGGVRF